LYGSEDQDLYQNVTDPQHCSAGNFFAAEIFGLSCMMLCFGFVSGSGFNGVPGSVFGSGSRRAKMTYKLGKKLLHFIFWSARCSLFRAEGFSCCLDISKLEFFIKKDLIKFSAVFFSSVFSHQNPGSGLDPDSVEMLDPDSVNSTALL
jgi:hypothetical protein